MNIHRIKYKDIEKIPQLQVNKNFKQNFQGSSPAPFIGRIGYPNINVGFLSPQFIGEMEEYDSPAYWAQQQTSVGEIASKRYSLVNSRQKAHVKQLSDRFLTLLQEVGMAKKAVDMEVALSKIPTLNFNEDTTLHPFGPGSSVVKARITANPKADTRVEKVIYDTDLKASSALLTLYSKGFEENSLTKLLSVGTLGLKHNRKLVPTRWSITATDDTIGKELITQIKEFPVGEYMAYLGGGWGNYYLLLFFPEVWSYELFETYLSSPVNPWSKQGYAYSTDYEPYAGRTTYAEETAGGYYAARLPILECMNQNKRQYACVALRFITEEYTLPLGVWVCREATRKATHASPLIFASQELLLQYAASFIAKKFGFNIHLLLRQSKLLQEKKQQTKITQF